MQETSGHLEREAGVPLAWRAVAGRGPTVVWLGGFRSDMTGTKAQALADQALATGRAFLRFDYSGHGESGGAFTDGTIGSWRADALALIDRLTEGDLVLVGSSMGGWLACLCAQARPDRVKGLVLVAPAADFPQALMVPEMTAADRAALARDGVWMRPSDYGDPYPIARRFLKESADWNLLPGPVEIDLPVRILQGGADPDVPWRHALALAETLTSQDLVFSLVRDGDHRLSRPQDINRLLAFVDELCG
jgi:pimeloyl-ACP methyl ester carboxylesterase